MGKFWSFILLGTLQFAIIPQIAESQRSRSVGIQDAEVSRDPNPFFLEAAKPSVGKYVGIGALAGGLTSIGVLGLYLSKSNDECICSPIVFAPVVLGSAVLGASVGYLAYRSRVAGDSEPLMQRKQTTLAVPPYARRPFLASARPNSR